MSLKLTVTPLQTGCKGNLKRQGLGVRGWGLGKFLIFDFGFWIEENAAGAGGANDRGQVTGNRGRKAEC